MEDEKVPVYVITEAMIRRVIREEVANHFAFMEPAKLAYTVDEAARATGLGVAFIRAQIRNNYMAARYAGSRPIILIPADELKRWVESLPDDPRGVRR
ncbi:helix-turn-helix domain-containing protein [uncultured Microbacterium sp.]|uniref:helix-turn-helix domain-containing protein n=1 Tax=uncultured Microbacterium sp. TaxID=191216 RepID=UPI0028D4F28B|nr:helix-turn-helix domain-containing protein [uncultured Microbacterium sp.]